MLTCIFCGREIASRSWAHRLIQGWEKQRKQGGTNHVSLKEPVKDEHGNEQFACDLCVSARINFRVGQEAMF
jgi:hypothetical protein